MRAPVIDVILVNYNSTRDTIECLVSLKRSNYVIRKIIIVDNSNKPQRELENFLAADSSIEYIRPGNNLGFGGGNNLGIKKSMESNPDYILLLNNDTVVKEGFLDKLIDGSIREGAGLSTGKIYYYDRPDVIWGAGGWIDWKRGMGRLFGINQKDVGQWDRCKEVSFISGCMMLVKREVFERIGLLDEKYFMYHEDVDFCLRALDAKFKLAYIADSVIWHRVGAVKPDKTPFYFYYFIRNSLFIIEKFADLKQKTRFFCYSLPYFSVKLFFAIFSDFNFLVALLYGVCDGLSGNGGLKKYAFLQKK